MEAGLPRKMEAGLTRKLVTIALSFSRGFSRTGFPTGFCPSFLDLFGTDFRVNIGADDRAGLFAQISVDFSVE